MILLFCFVFLPGQLENRSALAEGEKTIENADMESMGGKMSSFENLMFVRGPNRAVNTCSWMHKSGVQENLDCKINLGAESKSTALKPRDCLPVPSDQG